MKLKYLSVIFSITGILILYYISILSQIPVIQLSEISKYEDKKITTVGNVLDYQITKYGSQIITIKDNNSTATIFIEGSITLEYGDKIQVTGEVQKYNNEWEIVGNNEKSIKILEKWHNQTHPLWEIAQNPNKYLNQNINITGYIDRVYDDHLYLRDIDEEFNIIVYFTSFNQFQENLGKEVFVAGFLKYDKINLRYILEINDYGHGVFTFQ